MEETSVINEIDFKMFVKNRFLASQRVLSWVGLYTKQEISDFIGISRPTLNERLLNHTWRTREIKNILKYMQF